MAALSPGRRRALVVARRLYAVVLVALVAWVVVTQADAVRDVASSGRPLVLLACLLAAFGQLALTSAVWTSGLRSLGATVPFTASLRTTAAAGPTRYLPGSIWYAVSRGVALRQAGVSGRALTAVATLETLLVPVVGFALGAALLAATGTSVAGVPVGGLVVVSVALLAVASPPAVNAVLRWRGGEDPLRLTWPAHLRLLGWICVFWLWSAGVFALYVSAFPSATDAGPVTLAGAYMLAWGVGWLAILAPQGVGVFEVTFAALVQDGSAVVGLAVLLTGYRAVIAVRDLVGAGVAAGVGRRGAARLPT